MITMKKVLAFLFATVLGFSLVGCDDQSGSSVPESSEVHQHTFATTYSKDLTLYAKWVKK